jgi:tetratricopeptide (TPR) repeat protein
MKDHEATPVCLSELQVASLQGGIRNELRVHPRWPDLWNFQGLIRAFHGDFEGARADFQTAFKLKPSYWRAHWNECWAAVLADPARRYPSEPDEGSGDAHLARLLSLVRDFLRSRSPERGHGPDTPALGFVFLITHATSGNTRAFEKTLAVMRSRDRKIDELFEAARLSSGGRVDETRIAQLGRPGLVNPGFCDLLKKVGRIESVSGDSEEALRLFALAALFEGNRAAFLLEKVEILSRSGRETEVLPLLTEAVQINPDWFRAHVALGYELSAQGIVSEALHHLERAVSLEPGYPDLHYQCGLLLHAAARNDEAIANMENALQCNPTYLVARIALANLLFDAKREAEAAPHFARVFEEGIETPLLAGRFGYAVHVAGSKRRADEVFRQAISQDNDRPDLLCLYGKFLSETDRSEEARTVWKRALGCGPSTETKTRIETLLAESRETENRE